MGPGSISRRKVAMVGRVRRAIWVSSSWVMSRGVVVGFWDRRGDDSDDSEVGLWVMRMGVVVVWGGDMPAARGMVEWRFSFSFWNWRGGDSSSLVLLLVLLLVMCDMMVPWPRSATRGLLVEDTSIRLSGRFC